MTTPNIHSNVHSKIAVDFTSCDREPVQFSGAIQPHGAMVVLEEPQLLISEASANCLEQFGTPASALLNAPLTKLLPAEHAAAILRQIRTADLGPIPTHFGPITLHQRRFELFAHKVRNKIILEWELAFLGPVNPASLYTDVRSCISQLRTAKDVPALLDTAVQHIRTLTGFDRVLAYKFLEDGTGHIQAEATCADLHSFVGLHFPPGDVPAPARRVLSLVWVRSQPDISYSPVPIESAGGAASSLDLSYSILRSTSPMCNRYYQNLGVLSKLVVALLNEGEMWGAIICQHRSPKQLSLEVRMACETIAHAVSLSLYDKERSSHSQAAIQIRQKVESLASQISADPFWIASLSRHLYTCLPVGGAAALLDGGVLLQGNTPSQVQVLELAQWLEQLDSPHPPPTFASRQLSSRFPPASEYRHLASGLLAVRLGVGEYLMWFRPEIPYEVSWAGDPQKPVKVDEHNGVLQISPRTSFQMQRSMLPGIAEPWKPYEIEAVASLGQTVASLRRVDLLNQSLTALQARSADVESFAYIAAHDLREPLRGIKTFSQLLSSALSENIGEKEKSRLLTIDRLANRMEDLLQALLRYSRISGIELNRKRTDLNAVLAQALDTLAHELPSTGAKITLLNPLPEIECDPIQVHQIFVNLIHNGVKYNTSPSKAIEIGCLEHPEPTFFVRDNGIGIPPEHHNTVFQIFRRLHGREDFGGGSGAGLTIVRKIVEHHGGKIWLESKLSEGSTFFFTIPPPQQQPASQTAASGRT